MEMNRPSIYAAFGDKRALYLETLKRYWAAARAAIAEGLADGGTIAAGLRRMYARAIDIYVSGDHGPRGCYAIGTAVTGAMVDPEVRGFLLDGTRESDAAFVQILAAARRRGELADDVDPAALAPVASATIHTLAIRARAGATRAELDAIADGAIETLFGRRG